MLAYYCILLLVPGALSSVYSDPHCAAGRSVITHLFEWKWTDIAEECERFLGPYGYCGVQISPPNENRVIPPCYESQTVSTCSTSDKGLCSITPSAGSQNRPWWERYQPVSYKLITRSGTEQELQDMISRCNKVGVRIYADAVINHMASVNEMGHGTAGTPFDAIGLYFPGVPYGPTDFNDHSECHTNDLTIHDYQNPEEVRNCRLGLLADLRLGKQYVREKIADYLNHLISLGVTGFRIDASKHIWPGDLSAILDKTDNLRSDIFGIDKRPFIYQEVIDMGNEPVKGEDYVNIGRVTNFIYGTKLSQVFKKKDPMKYLSNWGPAWGMLASGDSVVFIDNHDNQRGHGGGGGVLTHTDPRPYKAATAFMLAHPYGFPRVMSSYNFVSSDEGPPHNGDMSTKSVSINSDMTCGNGWTCEHRWRQMYNMVAFRNIAGFSGLSNWWSGADYQIAFSREYKAFIAFNLEDYDLNQNLNTGLPQGQYCDVISGNLENGTCTGKTITVGEDGHAQVEIRSTDPDPVVAIHIGVKIDSPPSRIALGSMYSDPNCASGRSAITHLFEWRWQDIAAECERFLGPYGYCGVQISPPNENRVVTSPNRPWWERYQPVSYKLQTRSGSENDLKDMVTRCNKAGVRIYADVVINHMTGVGGTGHGTAGSSYDANSLHFPAVPYGPTDFNDGSGCHTGDLQIHNYNNAEEVRNCRLVGLLDLQAGKDYVRGEIAGYLNHLVDIGVAGFRVDAAKHMWPGDLTAIFGRVKNLRSDMFGGGKKPFIFQEVIDMGGEPIKGSQYLGTGRVTNFIFGIKLADVFRKHNAMKYLSNWGSAWGMLASGDSVVFIDNHDNQRGHGGGGGVLTHTDPRPYKAATAFMLAHPYGFPRVMSSYNFGSSDEGPPHNGDMSTKSVSINGMVCGNGWTCEHRWRQMYNMVAFRNIAGFSGLSNWWSGADYQIAFSRGNKAFIAFNLEDNDLNQNLNTGLPQGQYCDVISGNLENGKCTGATVNVGGDGHAHIHISGGAQDPMVAIHAGAKVGSSSNRVG